MSAIDTGLAQRLGSRHQMTEAEGLATRFDAPGERQQHRRVRITASPAVAGTAAGQNLVWMLANLLARQFAVVEEVQVALPDVPLAPGVALFGARDRLPETVAATVRAVAGTAMNVVVAGGAAAGALGPADAEVMVGLPASDPTAGSSPAENRASAAAPFRVGALADGWKLYVGDPAGVPAVVPAEDGNPFGAYFAACLAAGEVFKRLSGLKEGRGQYARPLFMSLWDYERGDSWDDLPAGEWPGTSGGASAPLELPPLYLIGVGAVGQAASASFAAAGSRLRGYVTLIDREVIDDTNLNRYPLATLSDLNASKSGLCASVLERAGFGVYAYDGGWPDYVTDASRPLQQRTDLRELEAGYRYRLVLSCVDRNTARHAIQSFWPELLLGASTLDLGVAVALYDMRSAFECLKCFNEPEPQGATVEQLARELRQLDPAERRARCEAVGADWQAIEVYLTTGRCGELGERELAKFEPGRERADWSVGFASVAAGTLLAAQVVKLALVGKDEAFPEGRGNTLRFSFLNPGPYSTPHRRRRDCECMSAGAADYDALWE